MVKKILRTGRFALPLLLIGCIAGCSSVPMPKGNSKAYSSARFIVPNKAIGQDSTPRFVEANSMIKAAIVSQLEQHGVKVVKTDADLLIAHLIILQDNICTSYSNQYFGYQDFTGLLDLAHKEGMKGTFAEHVEKRALVIDLIDAKTSKLVYRDYVVGRTLSNLPAAERQAQIDAAVAQALQKFFK